jgi:hypothetical protein
VLAHCLAHDLLAELCGATLLILRFGATGAEIGRVAKAFPMRRRDRCEPRIIQLDRLVI